jgi:pimeloyl-ACP methyl ester carboxylesterase
MSLTKHGPAARPSQLSQHGAARVELRGRHGPIAALRTSQPGEAVALLVPGYTGSKEDFAPLLDGFAAEGFETVAIDLPGQYESPGPDAESAYLPAALGGVVTDVIEQLASDGRPVLLLGHSYGGLVARGAVLAGAPVAGLTLLDSGPRHLSNGMRLQALQLGEPLLRENGIAAAYALREEVSSRFPGWAELPGELKNFFRTRFVSSSAIGLVGMAQGLRTEPDLVDELRKLKLPCAVVAGEHDDAWSVPDQEAMAKRLNATFSLIGGAAHSPNTENPAGLLEALLPIWHSWLG